MKRFIIIAIALIVGICIGWYLGYTRPVTKQYRILRDDFGLSDQEMAQFGAQVKANLPQMIEQWKRSDDEVTALALGALKRLEQDNIDGAKGLLFTPVIYYYREYHEKGGDRNIIAKIEQAAQQYPEIANKIAMKNESPP